jgi:hypothetical protein
MGNDLALQITFLVAVLVLIVGQTTRAGGRWGGRPFRLLLGALVLALLILLASLAIDHFRAG